MVVHTRSSPSRAGYFRKCFTNHAKNSALANPARLRLDHAVNSAAHTQTHAPTWPAGPARFCTTQWTVVLAAGGSGPERDAALEHFCQAYWYPIYAFLRRRGATAEDARDLTQDFFAQLLAKDWLAGIERRATRFSTLLLTVLQRFCVDAHRRTTREKRGGSNLPLSLDLAQAEAWFGAEPATDATPERIFERRWALAVLDAALTRLRDDCRLAGRTRLFDALSPFLSRDSAPGEYEAAAGALGLTPRAVAVAVHRLRGDFRAMVREEVGAGVADRAQVEEEMRHLAAALM
jgi:RNA polymerase sigma-70 factor (ECF subfamily)